MGIPRNDFTPAPRYASDYCEDTYRETREHFDAMMPSPPISEDERAAADHYSNWCQQRRDYHSLGHVAYRAKYGSHDAPDERYTPPSSFGSN